MTIRQDILDFIKSHVAEHGFPPSVREVGQAVGLSSTSTVQHYLVALQREGKLTRHPRFPRTLVVKDDAA